VNAYTSALASAAGGFITETPAAATRPTPGEASFFDWDSTFAHNFEYTVDREGAAPGLIAGISESGGIWYQVRRRTPRCRPLEWMRRGPVE